MSRIFTTSVASAYPHYVTKVEKKGRSRAELDEVIEWLTGYDQDALRSHLDRYLDKLVDELAKGRPMEKVLRG